MSRRAPRCPDCPGAPVGVRLLVGLPSAELFEAAERGDVVLGGCEVFPGPTPRWACPQCHRPLGVGSASPGPGPSHFGLDAVIADSEHLNPGIGR